MDLDKIIQWAEVAQQQFDLPSLGIGISQGDQHFTAVYGDADEQTLYPLASISKTFLATAICRLAQQQRIDLDLPLKKYWSDFRLQDSYATTHLTWRDVLCHRSGLPAHNVMRFTNRNKQQLSLEQIATKVRYLQPSCELRYKMHYSNLMYAVASYAFEQVVQEDYGTYLRKNLLQPLNLQHTYINHHEKLDAPIVTPYIKTTAGQVISVPFIAPGPVGGASSMLATIADLLHWGEYQLKSFQESANPRFQPQMVMSSRSSLNGAVINYGLGMMLENYQGYQYFYHSGSFIGCCSLMGIVPELDLTFVLTTNLDSTTALFALAYQIIDLAIGNTSTDWLPKGLEVDQQRREQVLQRQIRAKAMKSVAVVPELLGDYQNAGYGLVTITKQDDCLQIVLGPVMAQILQDAQRQMFVQLPESSELLPLTINSSVLQLHTEPAIKQPTIFQKVN
ncbi:serine hydrolase domain-containing protein [Bombilactobacillus thymidiniphilus]|uniref:Beta-lactamase family protein n=1 Tax=Bombilactobacillus thymidiniphilus TaxID=2923363 RepID=A0ABY4PBU7_9LACO|nr:serine hydrolase domain-containing protein [Bombilactobacillus thymidiniphilus]UQS83248.1 beta-lactamase family protein [Bombilactobacillus thymidiniphilus]